MVSVQFSLLILIFSLTASLTIRPSRSQTCTSQTFTSNKLYSNCLDLPTLTSYLHYSYNSSNSTLSIAFLSTPPSDGWISWAINPTSNGMAGAQALVGFKDSNGTMTVKTYNISSYDASGVVQGKISFDVWDERAEMSGGVMRIFANIKIPADLSAKGTVNQVWQVGPGLDLTSGALTPHAMQTANINSKGTLSLTGGQTTVSTGGGGVDSRTRKRNIHGVLNVVSWGILFPIGIIIARYIRTFESADPAWFYMHISCQVSGYSIGVAGWATGLKLGSDSKGIQYSSHRNIGIALFALATLQIFALFLRPKKDHKYRFYWNIYHHGVGYGILVLGILNVFKGFDILNPEKKWKSAYIIVIAVLGGIALLLELVTWIVVLRRKSSKSTKPYDGYNNNGQANRQRPLNP